MATRAYGKGLMGRKTAAEPAVRAAIYARYSSEMQKASSIDDQIRECTTFIDRQGWRVGDGLIFVDRAVSGNVANRTGYVALKAAAAAGAFSYIVVDDLSRFGRDALESLSAFQELKALGVNIVGVSDGINTANRGSKVPYYFKSLMNDFFLDDLSEKVMRGLKGRAIDGMSTGGRVFGYRYTEVLDPTGARDKSGRVRRLGVQVSIDPEQAKVVKRIFDLRAKGYGFRSIAQLLSAEGVPSPRYSLRGRGEKTWAFSSVISIVTNEKYIGDWTWNRFEWVKIPGSRKRLRRQKPMHEWVVCQRKNLRIVSDAVWKKAQRRRANGRTDSTRTQNAFAHPQVDNRGKFILSGLLKCSECGSNMIAMSDRGASSYVCNKHWSRGDIACGNKLRVPRKLVEDLILSGIQAHFLDPDLVMRLVKKVQKRMKDGAANPQKQIREQEAAIGRLQSEIDNLTEFVVQGDTSKAIREALSAKEEELVQAQSELEFLEHRRSEAFPDISEAWVRNKLADIRTLFNSRNDRVPQIRLQLREILGDQIEMTPTGDGELRHYVAGLKGRPLAILNDLPHVSHVHSATGIRTVTDTYVDLGIALLRAA